MIIIKQIVQGMICILRKSRSAFRCALNFCLEIYLRMLPIKKTRITFCSYGGRDFGDNPAFIASEILRRGIDVELIWLSNFKDVHLPCGIKVVRRGGFQEKIALATSRLVVSNTKHDLTYEKKRGAYYLQTWHGDTPIKLIEGECESMLGKWYVSKSKEDSLRTDAILSGCEWFSALIRKSFWLRSDCEILEYGNPRNDIYYRLTTIETKKMREKYGIRDNQKVVLYAPTFRDSGAMSCYDINLDEVIKFLNIRTGQEWIAIARLHPDCKGKNVFSYSKTIIDGSAFADPQELNCVADVLITDVSSIMFDFMILNKPIYIYFSDHEEYIRSCRGLRPLYHKLPLKICHTTGELIDEMMSFNSTVYWGKVKVFQRECEGERFDDGHASERVADWIEDKIKNG